MFFIMGVMWFEKYLFMNHAGVNMLCSTQANCFPWEENMSYVVLALGQNITATSASESLSGQCNIIWF